VRKLTQNLCAAVLLLASHAPVALAIPVYEAQLDQYSFLTPGNSGIAYLTSPNEEFRRAQSFTVGIGGQLDSILVEFNPAVVSWGEGVADQMRLLSMNNGVPGEVLATSAARTLTPFNTPTNNYVFGTFDFTGFGLNFNVGDVLAFEIIYDGGVQWYEDTYAGGSDLIINPGFYENWTAIPQIDTAFQTYMAPRQLVPEPSILWLLAAGLVAAFVLKNRCNGRISDQRW